MTTSSLSLVPNEIIGVIFGFLDAKDSFSSGQVCRLWRSFSSPEKYLASAYDSKIDAIYKKCDAEYPYSAAHDRIKDLIQKYQSAKQKIQQELGAAYNPQMTYHVSIEYRFGITHVAVIPPKEMYMKLQQQLSHENIFFDEFKTHREQRLWMRRAVFGCGPTLSVLCLMIATIACWVYLDLDWLLSSSGSASRISMETYSNVKFAMSLLIVIPLVFVSLPCYLVGLFVLHMHETFFMKFGYCTWHGSIRGLDPIHHHLDWFISGFPAPAHVLAVLSVIKLFVLPEPLSYWLLWTLISIPVIAMILLHWIPATIAASPYGQRKYKYRKKRPNAVNYVSTVCFVVFAVGSILTIILCALKLDNFGGAFTNAPWLVMLAPFCFALSFIFVTIVVSMCMLLNGREHDPDKPICITVSAIALMLPLIVALFLLALKLDFPSTIGAKMPFLAPFVVLFLWEFLWFLNAGMMGCAWAERDET